MQPDELQHSVDTLAARLRRSVSVDAPSMRLLAASRHFGDEDPARVRSVLDRYAGDEETKFVLSQGVANWTRPGRVPAHPPHLSARLCVPLRCHGILLGYLWLIDPDETLGDREVGITAEATEQIGLLLYRRLLLHERELARIGSLLRDLISPDTAARARAAQEIRDDGLLAADDYVIMLSAEAFGMADANARDHAAVSISAAVEAAGRAVPPRTVLSSADGCRALVLVAAAAPPAEKTINELVAIIEREFTRRKGPGDQIVIGVGSARHGLGQVAESYRHASTAARAARLLPRLGPVARWERLGPYALLLQLPPDHVISEDWIPALAALRRADPHGGLVSTLEAFLDNAGDVQRTARQLRVHRTTLYHRLQRIERVAQVDLRDGTDRLTLHLGLKLGKLADARQTHG
ncbi:helix-turn-helix domain-containing protein [Actinoallomurus sp. NPDC050550]|uniref:PucR family transcriptional regulator n=1 Tax=Actinoallomurus sp. NPDC050550 TaxID=3154937 RepID=UPI0033F187EE